MRMFALPWDLARGIERLAAEVSGQKPEISWRVSERERLISTGAAGPF